MSKGTPSIKTKHGHMGCPDCGERVVVKINQNETLSYRCDECDGNGYCKKGEARYSIWMKKITPAQGAAPAQEPKPSAAPASEPKAPKQKGEKKPAQAPEPDAAPARRSVFFL